MTISEFEKRLRDLIEEVAASDLNTPADTLVEVMQGEIARIENADVRFMHEMRNHPKP